MDGFTGQQALLDQLCDLMRKSAPDGHEACRCVFRYDFQPEDGSISTGARFSYQRDGAWVPAQLLFPDRGILVTVIPKLHSLMMGQTGGDWRALTIDLDRAGSAKVEFDYAQS